MASSNEYRHASAQEVKKRAGQLAMAKSRHGVDSTFAVGPPALVPKNKRDCFEKQSRCRENA
jgi:hypothetical protein